MSETDHPRGLPVDVPNVEVEQTSGFRLETDQDGAIRSLSVDVVVYRLTEKCNVTASTKCNVEYDVDDRVATGVAVEPANEPSLSIEDGPQDLQLWEFAGAIAGANRAVIETDGLLDGVIALPEYMDELYEQDLTPPEYESTHEHATGDLPWGERDD